MLQQDEPDDLVIATGEAHTVREFVELAFSAVGLNMDDYVGVDERYLRPSEVDLLLGDATKAREQLGWEPQVSFEQLAEIMVGHDWKIAREELAVARHQAGVD